MPLFNFSFKLLGSQASNCLFHHLSKGFVSFHQSRFHVAPVSFASLFNWTFQQVQDRSVANESQPATLPDIATITAPGILTKYLASLLPIQFGPPSDTHWIEVHVAT